MRPAEELIACIANCSQIPPARRRAIQRELGSHVEDFITASREAGCDEGEIEKLVQSRFGDPAQIALGFARVYRHERRMFQVIAYALSTLCLAGALWAVILALQAGMAFGVGTPIMDVLASRHAVIEGFDIVASIAAYLGLTSFESLFETRQFQKAVLLLSLIVAGLILSCGAVGWHSAFLLYGLINGVFFRALQLFVASKAARVGLVVVCFALAGVVSALLRSPGSQLALATTCASWLVMGAGYQLVSHLAVRVDAALFNGLQRIQVD